MSPPPETARFRFGLALFFVHLLAQPPVERLPGNNSQVAAKIRHFRLFCPMAAIARRHFCRCHLEACNAFSFPRTGRRNCLISNPMFYVA
jgi:hypothetical protein